MVEFYVLPIHASQALGVRVAQVNLPRSGYGVSGNALWIDPRFIEVRRQREVVARQMAEHRHEIHADLSNKPREKKLELCREGARARRARARRRKAMRAAASI
jgi:hypothetical protein